MMCLGWMDSQAEFENLKFKPTGIFIDGSAVVALQSMLHIKAGSAELQGCNMPLHQWLIVHLHPE